MIESTPELTRLLSEGDPSAFRTTYIADLIVDGETKLQDVQLTGELICDGDNLVLTQGTLTLVYSDELGRSVVPEDLTSWVTPVATFVDVSYRVTVGSLFEETILRGRLKVVGVSDPQERNIRFQDRKLTVGSSIRLKVADLFARTNRERFLTPSPPTSLTSAWDELGRLTGLPLDRSVPDVPITRAIVYEENRLEAVESLGSLLGGVPYMTPAGEVSVAPTTWGASVTKLTTGPEGRISRADPDDLSADEVYNGIVVRSWDTDQATILATAYVTEGPLRWGGPFGKVPFFASSQLVKTKEQAQAYANQLLPQKSKMGAVDYTIQCAPDPRLEVWDVIEFEKDKKNYTGRIKKITLPHQGLMTLVVSVPRG